MKPSTFTSLGDESIAGLISSASSRIVYAAPNVSATIAAAIMDKAATGDELAIRVIVDADPQVFRLGLGEFKGFSELFDSGVDIRQAFGLRIAVLIVDDRAWVFAPTPEVILDQPDESILNGVEVSPDFAQKLLSSVASDLKTEVRASESSETIDEAASAVVMPSATEIPTPEIMTTPVTIDVVEAVEKELKVAPPQQFDLSRRVNVYKAYYQFVDIELSNCNIGAFTIPLTDQLLDIVDDGEVRRRLTAKYKLVDADSKVKKDLEGIRDAVRDLRSDYTIMINEKLGRVIATEKKEAFLKRKEKISQFIGIATKKMKAELNTEIEENCQRLAKVLLPIVKNSPPRYLRHRLLDDLSNDDEIVGLIVNALMPSDNAITKLITGMKLEVVFKDITYEMLNDADFVNKIRSLQEEKKHIFEQGAAIEEKKENTRSTLIVTQNDLPN